MRIATSAFRDGDRIPGKHTKDGADISPPLVVEELPEGCASLALVVDDPDASAGPWVHWLIWGIPVRATALPEDVPGDGVVAVLGGARQGMNDFGEIGYGGPRPPRGRGPHHYRFTVHALDAPIELAPGASRDALEGAMAGHVLATARVTGVYERG